MTFIFECVVEADLAKEEVLYSGRSAKKALDHVEVSRKFFRLFELWGIVKIRRFRQVGGRIDVLCRYIFKDGEVDRANNFFDVRSWYNENLKESK